MLFYFLFVGLRTRAGMHAEIIALHHQLIVLQRSQRPKRLILNPGDRSLWVWLSRLWSSWRSPSSSSSRKPSSAGFVKDSAVLDVKGSARKVRASSSFTTDSRFDSMRHTCNFDTSTS